jgi:hypothetical protein
MSEGITQMLERGYALIQYGAGFGLDDDGEFAYFDTEVDLKAIIELRQLPRRRREPEWRVEVPTK